MKKFFSSIALARLLWAVGLLLIAAGAAQAQVFAVTSITPNAGAPGQSIAISGTNALANTPTRVAFVDAGGTAVFSNVNASALNNTIVTTNVPALSNGNYLVLVELSGTTLTIPVGPVTVVGVPGAFTVNNALPLPVQLTAFAAEAAGSGARLRWATASEKDNDHFDVEASTDGRTFARVGQVAGHGSTMLPQQYSFTDENLGRYAAPLVYYRLRQVDLDGASNFSQVRTVAVATGKPVLVLYPTVATVGEATRYAYAGTELTAGATLEIYSLAGRRVLTQPLSEATGTLNSQSLAPGWYWVRLPAAGTTPVRFYRP